MNACVAVDASFKHQAPLSPGTNRTERWLVLNRFVVERPWCEFSCSATVRHRWTISEHRDYMPVFTVRLKCDGTRPETRFRLSAKRTNPFKSAGASVQSNNGSRGVRISGSNAGYTMFRGSVTSTGYPLHSPVSPSLLLPWVTVCHGISTGLY